MGAPVDVSARCRGQLGDLSGRPVGTRRSVAEGAFGAAGWAGCGFFRRKKCGDPNGFLKMYPLVN